MRWYINDLSVQGQYTSPLEFVELLSRMLALKIRVRRIGSNLFCSRDQFRNRPVLPGTTVVEALRNSSQRDLRNMSLSWLDKSGPFLEDSRLQQTDDLFFFENHDVTDQGLGEAARQRLAFRATASFSFPGGQVDFCKDSLFIQQGFPNELISTVQLQNFWTLDGLEKHAQLCEDTPDSWTSLLAFCA